MKILKECIFTNASSLSSTSSIGSLCLLDLFTSPPSIKITIYSVFFISHVVQFLAAYGLNLAQGKHINSWIIYRSKDKSKQKLHRIQSKNNDKMTKRGLFSIFLYYLITTKNLKC